MPTQRACSLSFQQAQLIFPGSRLARPFEGGRRFPDHSTVGKGSPPENRDFQKPRKRHWSKKGWVVLKLFRVTAFSLGFLFNLNANAEAQSESPPFPAPFIGVTVGAGSMPVTFFDGCILEDRFGEHRPGLSAAFSIGVPMGPFTVLTQTTANGEAILGADDHCTSVEPGHESGTHSDRLRGVETGSFSTTDLRLRFEFPMRYPVVASAGAGWAWTHEIPFWDATVGLRTSGRLRWGLDLAYEGYRMPFELVIREWENSNVLQVLRQETVREWQGAWQLRIGAEWSLR